MPKGGTKIQDEEDCNTEEAEFQFKEGESEDDDDMSYFNHELENLMNNSSTYSEQRRDTDIVKTSAENQPKVETKFKVFGPPVQKNRSAYNFFIKDKVIRYKPVFEELLQ